MEHPGFFERAGQFPLRILSEVAGASLANGPDADAAIRDVKPLDAAAKGDLSFLDNPRYLSLFVQTGADACLVAQKFASHAPSATACLLTPEPYKGFAKVLALFYPDAMKPKAAVRAGAGASSPIHPSARLDEGAIVEPGAVVGPEASIGAGTVIAAGSVIGYRVHVGRDCYIGPNATITHTLLGNRVTIHAGASVGQ